MGHPCLSSFWTCAEGKAACKGTREGREAACGEGMEAACGEGREAACGEGM